MPLCFGAYKVIMLPMVQSNGYCDVDLLICCLMLT